MVEQYSFHTEFYNQAIKQMYMTAGKLCENIIEDFTCLGWLEWFENTYPEQFKKYNDALIQVNLLWGNMDPKAMEEFKKAVKIEVDATKWAVEKYIEYQEKQVEQERMKGT